MTDRQGMVTICSVCGTAIETQADRYAQVRANEVRTWAEAALEEQSQHIRSLEARVGALERVAHSHH